MRAKKPIRKKTTARKMKQVIDLRIKEIILERDGYSCLKCGGNDTLQAAHILPKGLYQRLRFYPENLLTLCLRCHLYWAHKDPLAFASWLNEKFPGLEQRLRERARNAEKLDLKQLYQQVM